MTNPIDIPPGTLELLILRTLALRPAHGVGVADRIRLVTGGAFAAGPGSLFPALRRLEDSGYIQGRWGESENKRRARFYEITEEGRKQLEEKKRHWLQILAAVSSVLDQEA